MEIDRVMRLLICIVSVFYAAGLYAEEKISREPLVLNSGGTADKPAVFDGKGMTIDLGIDVSDHGWIKEGNIWKSDGPLKGRKPIPAGQLAGLFLDVQPLRLPRDVEAEKRDPSKKQYCYVAPEALKPGEMGYLEDGSLYFRWPENMDRMKARIILPPKSGTSAVSIGCSHIIVRNLTVKYSANDGFNIHGKWVGIRLENVRAFSNADEGISAHGEVEMTVDGAEVAWNGSLAGGVADVGQSVTSYRNCEVHDNLGSAFYFSGKEHHVTDSLIYNQKKDFNALEGSIFTQKGNTWRK